MFVCASPQEFVKEVNAGATGYFVATFKTSVNQGRAFAFFPNANRTAKPNRACRIRRTEPELEFALLELKRTELRTNTPSTRAHRQGCLPFLESFFFKAHGDLFDVLLSPEVLFKSCLVPLRSVPYRVLIVRFY